MGKGIGCCELRQACIIHLASCIKCTSTCTERSLTPVSGHITVVPITFSEEEDNKDDDEWRRKKTLDRVKTQRTFFRQPKCQVFFLSYDGEAFFIHVLVEVGALLSSRGLDKREPRGSNLALSPVVLVLRQLPDHDLDVRLRRRLEQLLQPNQALEERHIIS